MPWWGRVKVTGCRGTSGRPRSEKGSRDSCPCCGLWRTPVGRGRGRESAFQGGPRGRCRRSWHWLFKLLNYARGRHSSSLRYLNYKYEQGRLSSALLKTLLKSLETWKQPVAHESFAVGLRGWKARGQVPQGGCWVCGGAFLVHCTPLSE